MNTNQILESAREELTRRFRDNPYSDPYEVIADIVGEFLPILPSVHEDFIDEQYLLDELWQEWELLELSHESK